MAAYTLCILDVFWAMYSMAVVYRCFAACPRVCCSVSVLVLGRLADAMMTLCLPHCLRPNKLCL
jgi:hypothetical protein